MPYKDRTGPGIRAARQRYSQTEKSRAARRRYVDSDHGHAVRTENTARRIATGQQVQIQRDFRERERAYSELLFAPSPDKRITVPGVSTMVVLSDLQIPFDDPAAVDQALAVIDRVGPDTVVLNGDIVDCYRESAFLQDFRIAETVTDEQHRRARVFMAALRGVKQKIWLGGNHEERWWRVIKSTRANGVHAPVVQNLVAMMAGGADKINLNDPIGSFAKLFDMAHYGVTYYPYSHRLYFAEHNLVITHGKYVSRHSGASAKRTFEWLGRSCIVGHTHRLGNYVVTQDGRERGAWENGCLCQLEPEYDDAPNWQQGFSVVRIQGPSFHVVQVPIVRSTPTSPPKAIYGE